MLSEGVLYKFRVKILYRSEDKDGPYMVLKNIIEQF